MSNAEREIAVESMDQAIGRRVHQLMWDRKVTARELAPHVGVDASGLGRRLRGERGWASDEIFVTARYFGVPVGVLFGESIGGRPSPSDQKAPTPKGGGLSVPPEGFEPPTSGTGNQRSIP